MTERIFLALGLMIAGVVLYYGVLYLQRRRASVSAKHLQTERPMLLVFTSPTCGACKLQQLPIVEKLMPEWGEKIDTLIVDVTEQPEFASWYGVWSLPTTIIVDASEKVIAINQGVASERTLREQFARALGWIPVRVPDAEPL